MDSHQWTVVSSGVIPSAVEGSSSRLTLRLGAKGEGVREMQKLLLVAGEILPKYGTDGSFGMETLAAVRSFQWKQKLVVDGICGKNTWGKLLEIGGEEP